MAELSFRKRTRYIFEAALSLFAISLLRILPLGISRRFAGFIAKKIGSHTSANKILKQNLETVLPEKSFSEREKIGQNTWQNLGKLTSEFINLGRLDDEKFKSIVEFRGYEIVEEAKREYGSFIMVSGHIGNWEIAARLCAQIDDEIIFIYRKANNPYMEKVIQKLRKPYLKRIVAKGSSNGIKSIIKHLKTGGSVAMLVDQKFSGGTEVEFFGRKVTAPDTHVELGMRTNIPVIAGRVIRKDNGKFFAEFERVNLEGKTKQQGVQAVYTIFERWIREVPDQWFWMHNRWSIKRK